MRKYFTPTFLKACFYFLFKKHSRHPVFIVGSGRCGSSLLVDVLKTNEELQVGQQEYYHLFLKTLKKGFEGTPFLTDIIDIGTITAQSIQSYSALDRYYIKALFNYFSNRDSCIYLLKSPAISLLLPILKDWFPKARFIHLYRNPYAVTLSLFNKEYFRVKRYQEHYSEEAFRALSAAYWKTSVTKIDDFLKGLKTEEYIEFSYEAFTENPVSVLTEIATFLNVSNVFTFDVSTIQSTNTKIENLPQAERASITEILGEILIQKGYEPIY